MEERGPSDPEYKDIVQRILTVSRVDTVLLLTIVVLMVWKPGA
jgi:hypothetical protein